MNELFKEDSVTKTALCVIPSTVLGTSGATEIVDYFKSEFMTRVVNVEEIGTRKKLEDGTFRKDIIFEVHEHDIPHFSKLIPRDQVAWWGEWVGSAGHRKDYPIMTLKRFEGFESVL